MEELQAFPKAANRVDFNDSIGSLLNGLDDLVRDVILFGCHFFFLGGRMLREINVICILLRHFYEDRS